jgi:hypothetical protein
MASAVPTQFNLVVSDMETSVASYRRLGVDIADADPEWQVHHRSGSGTARMHFDLDSRQSPSNGTRAGKAAWGLSVSPLVHGRE